MPLFSYLPIMAAEIGFGMGFALFRASPGIDRR